MGVSHIKKWNALIKEKTQALWFKFWSVLHWVSISQIKAWLDTFWSIWWDKRSRMKHKLWNDRIEKSHLEIQAETLLYDILASFDPYIRSMEIQEFLNVNNRRAPGINFGRQFLYIQKWKNPNKVLILWNSLERVYFWIFINSLFQVLSSNNMLSNLSINECMHKDEPITNPRVQQILLYVLLLRAYRKYKEYVIIEKDTQCWNLSFDTFLTTLAEFISSRSEYKISHCSKCHAYFIGRKNERNGCVFCESITCIPNGYGRSIKGVLVDSKQKPTVSSKRLSVNYCQLIDTLLACTDWTEYQTKIPSSSSKLWNPARFRPFPTTRQWVAFLLWVQPSDLRTPQDSIPYLQDELDSLGIPL